MNIFEVILSRIKGFDFVKIMNDIMLDENKQGGVIALIQKRLSEKGTDYEGKELKTDFAKSQNAGNKYAMRTISIKKRKGQETRFVTLRDTGSFYNSFDVFIKAKSLKIKADFQKDNGNISKNFQDSYYSDKEFSEAILKLTEEDKAIVFEKFIFPELKAIFGREVLKNV